MSKKLFTAFAVLSLMVTVFAQAVPPVKAATILDGDLVKVGVTYKGYDASAVYLISGTQFHAFPYLSVYSSWGYPSDFSTVKTVTTTDLDAYTDGGWVGFRNGTLFRGTTSSLYGNEAKAVFYVEDGKLRPVEFAHIYQSLFNDPTWKLVYFTPDAFLSRVKYDLGATITSSTTYPTGLFVKMPSGDYGVTAAGNVVREFSSTSAITANQYTIGRAANITTNLTEGTPITGAESSLLAKTYVPVIAIASGLTVTLASDNPVSTSILSDSTTNAVNMESMIPMVKLVFANGNSSDVKVNKITLTRIGIAADGDVNNAHLYDGNTLLADMTSSSTKVYTFNSSTGLFTVPANSTKTVTVKIELAAGVAAAKTLGLGINAAADVTLSNGGTLQGNFPVNGNLMTVAAVSDLGYLNLTNTTTFPATIDPSSDDQELWRLTATAQDQDMEIDKIIMTMVGTIASGDIVNLKLKVNNVQIGPTASIDSNNKVNFDFAGSPYKITKGQNKIIVLTGQVIKGTGRAFKFTIRSVTDFVEKDLGYSVYTTPLKSSAAFTVIDPDSSGDGTNINNGTLTVAVASDSPTGNIPTGTTGVKLAKFTYKANGEDIKVSYVRVKVEATIASTTQDNITNGKLYFNGSQVGSTDTDVADDTEVVYSLGNTVIISAGTTGVFEYYADTVCGASCTAGSGAGSPGANLSSGDTIYVQLDSGTTDATGQTSLANIGTAGATAKTLTVKTGTMSRALNTSMGDATTTNPTGVVGATNVRVGSFILTAGVGEGANVTQIVVGDKAGTSSHFGDSFQNLVLKHNGVALAPVQGTLTGGDGTDFTFNVSPTITIAAGQQYIVDAYADILSGATGYATAEVGLDFVSATATGVDTGSTVSDSLTALDLQKLVIASYGSLVISTDANTPVSNQLVMGELRDTVAIIDLTAGTPEDIQVNRIAITDTSSFAGSLYGVELYDGSTLIAGPIDFDAQSNGVATFNLTTPYVVPKGVTKKITVKASVSTYGNAVSGGSHTVNLAGASDIDSLGASSGTGITETGSGTGTAQYVYRTKVVASRASTSPSGSSTPGANADVLEVDVAANAAYDAVINAVAITMSGSMHTTGTGNAFLYKSTDLVTALATEAYVTGTATTTTDTTTVTGAAGAWNGIPLGATVRVYDSSATAYMTGGPFTVTALTSTLLTVNTAMSAAATTSDIVYYRPLETGNGKLYFGAQTTLTADLANSAVAATVASANGFALGDTVSFAGYNSTGVACTATGTVTSLSATSIGVSGGITVTCSSGTATIVYNYLSGTAANAMTVGQNSAAIAYTGNIGQSIGAGTTTTFVVKGDTTSTGNSGTTANLRADIASVGDLNWDDQVNYGVVTVTKNLPVYGNTLTFSY